MGLSGVPVVRSKLIAPQLPPFLIISARVEQLVRRALSRKAVMITAPAGYGKTTLMAAVLKAANPEDRVCWYRLDAEDRDPVFFFSHLVEALFPASAEEYRESRANIFSCSDFRLQYRYAAALICQELWAGGSRGGGARTYLVLDDIQQVQGAPEVWASLRYLAANLPGNFAIMASSRVETELFAGKLGLDKDILKITRNELTLSEKELRPLLKAQLGYSPRRELRREIMRRSEGWAAGIVMISQYLSRRGPGSGRAPFDREGGKELLFGYMTEEVLKTIEPGLMLFLVKAALLHDFTAPAAAAILKEEQAAHYLEQCERQGLFLQKMVGEKTIYRFHPLFQEALLGARDGHLTAAEIRDCHLQAAGHYLKEKIFDRAIEHFTAGGDTDGAVALISGESVELIALGAFEQLRRWLKLIPGEAISGSGVLLYLKSYLYQRGEEDSLILLKEALRIFEDEENPIMALKTLLAMMRFHAFKNDAANVILTLKRARPLAEPLPGAIGESSLAIIDFLLAVWEERFPEAAVLCRRANCFDLPDDWRWPTLFYSCILHCFMGRLDSAEKYIKEALEMELVRQTDLFKGYVLTYYAYVLHFKNNRPAFDRIKEEVISFGESYDHLYTLGTIKRLEAFARYSEGELERALGLLDSCTDYFERLGSATLPMLNRLTRCLWLSGEADPPELLAEAKEAFAVLTSTGYGFCIHEIGRSLLGAVAREAGDYDFAEQQLLTSIESSRAKKAAQILCGSRLHLAALYYDRGDQRRGEAALREALDLASEKGYEMFWDLHLPTLVELSLRSLKSGFGGGYGEKLLAAYFGEVAAAQLKEEAAGAAAGELKGLCRTFLSRHRAPADCSSPQVNIRLLGNFEMAAGGSVIPASTWKTKKIAGILKYLLLHRGRRVPREELMEQFWPQSDSQSASMSLRAALYELKKGLSGYNIAPDGPGALIHKNSSGLQIKRAAWLNVDTDRFLSLLQRWKKLRQEEAGGGEARAALEEAVALYRGHLLEEELYEDWSYFEREELKSAYLEAALALAALYREEESGSDAERILLKVLALDRYSEEACLELMKLYLAAGRRARAAELYLNFEKKMEQELGIKPESRLAALLHKEGLH